MYKEWSNQKRLSVPSNEPDCNYCKGKRQLVSKYFTLKRKESSGTTIDFC